jgi:hypothetical protein
MNTVFLCHACSDHPIPPQPHGPTHWVDTLRDVLESLGYNVSLDNFPHGVNHHNTVAERLQQSDVIIVCGSQAFLNRVADQVNGQNLRYELDLIREHHSSKFFLVVWDDAAINNFPPFISHQMGAVLLGGLLGMLQILQLEVRMERLIGKFRSCHFFYGSFDIRSFIGA